MENDYVDSVVSAWQRVEPDWRISDYALAVRIIRAGRLLDREFTASAQRLGLGTRGDSEVLLALRRSHPTQYRPRDLARVGLVTTAGMSGRLDRLERAGLVSRVANSTDGRAVDVALTRRGVELADRLIATLTTHASNIVVPAVGDGADGVSDLLRPLLRVLGDRFPTGPKTP